jgi:hypothetical protein
MSDAIKKAKLERVRKALQERASRDAVTYTANDWGLDDNNWANVSTNSPFKQIDPFGTL